MKPCRNYRIGDEIVGSETHGKRNGKDAALKGPSTCTGHYLPFGPMTPKRRRNRRHVRTQATFTSAFMIPLH